MNYSLDEVKEWACSLAILQYRNAPRNRALIKLLVELIFANNILLKIRDGFDLDSAIGIQLDIIGLWVGVDRFYSYATYETRPWFALINWNKEPDYDLQGGFSTYDNFDSLQGGFLSFNNILLQKNRMDDNAYRTAIRLKIIKNNLYATRKNIDNAIWNLFGGKVYTEWEINKLIYKYTNDVAELIKICENKHILPHPTGVQIEIEEMTNE